ncbi:MAG TPA: hypothetical protein PK570_06575 [Thermoanaerobaculia bacterium]|nr:hypothetical protein [Thermoanaerobaculia bacterium]
MIELADSHGHLTMVFPGPEARWPTRAATDAEVAELVARAARNLADLDLSEGGADPIALPARPLIALAVLGLDGLAGNDLPMTFAATLATLEARAGEPASP